MTARIAALEAWRRRKYHVELTGAQIDALLAGAVALGTNMEGEELNRRQAAELRALENAAAVLHAAMLEGRRRIAAREAHRALMADMAGMDDEQRQILADARDTAW